MVEQQKHKIRRGNAVYQDAAFTFAQIFRDAAERINPFCDISRKKSWFKKHALIIRTRGLISQNPNPKDVHKLRLL